MGSMTSIDAHSRGHGRREVRIAPPRPGLAWGQDHHPAPPPPGHALAHLFLENRRPPGRCLERPRQSVLLLQGTLNTAAIVLGAMLLGLLLGVVLAVGWCTRQPAGAVRSSCTSLVFPWRAGHCPAVSLLLRPVHLAGHRPALSCLYRSWGHHRRLPGNIFMAPSSACPAASSAPPGSRHERCAPIPARSSHADPASFIPAWLERILDHPREFGARLVIGARWRSWPAPSSSPQHLPAPAALPHRRPVSRPATHKVAGLVPAGVRQRHPDTPTRIRHDRCRSSSCGRTESASMARLASSKGEPWCQQGEQVRSAFSGGSARTCSSARFNRL